MLVFVLLVFFLGALFYYFVQNRYQFWKRRGFVSAPTEFFFGNLKNVGSKVSNVERFDEIYTQYRGKTESVGMYFFVAPTLMVLDLELIKTIYIRDFPSFHDRGFYYNKENDPLSANLVK
jgi:cytochrome P450 family 6